MKIQFDAITMAYKTLGNEATRTEYNEYIAQLQQISRSQNYWDTNTKNDEEAIEDPEVVAERERRRKERGKKRFEEDYSFANDQFFSSWQNRTNSHQNYHGNTADSSQNPNHENNSIDTMFDGKSLSVDVEITFAEAVKDGGCTQEISVQREVICGSCEGTREQAGSQSTPCYSCKGEGVKEDALFHNKTMCNTCKGHGSLVQNKCRSCKGQGLITKHETVSVHVDRFVEDGHCFDLELLGHTTLY